MKNFIVFLDQKVLMEPQWSDYNILQNMLGRLYDTKRRVSSDNAETQINAAISEPCFNCKGDHLSKNCRRTPHRCVKNGKNGHLEEFCERIITL